MAGSLVLCFNVDCDAGLEFHGEVVGEDGDFLDELFDQSLIELCDVGFLTGDEVLQLLDSVHDFFPVVAVEFGLFLLVAQPENLIGDGVIMEDKLGFSLIYMQAKEWAPDRVVGQPDIQSFVGAIAGKHGDGLFVTTAKFSQKAKDYANTHHIILIDGERLANLMIEYNFCVSTRKTFEIKAIDTDALAEYQDE